jgi:hypothetical protein
VNVADLAYGFLGVVRLAVGLVLLEAWGWALARWLFGDRVDSTQRAALGATLATGTLGLIAYLAWIAGLGLSFVVGAAVVLGLAGLANALAVGRRPNMTQEKWQVAAWAIASAAVAAIQGIGLSDSFDTFYHLAAPRSLLASGNPMVTDLIVARPPSLGLDPSSGIWPTVLAVLSRLSGLDPVAVVRWLSPVLAALIAVAFLALVRRVVGPRGRTLAMVLMLVVAYTLDFRWALYPNRMGLAFVAVALSAVVVFAEEGGWGSFAGATLLGATVAAVHLGAFELFVVVAVVFAALGVVLAGKERLRIAGVAAAGLLAGGVIAATKVAPAIGSIGFRVGNEDRVVDIRSQIPMIKLGPLAAMLPGDWLVGGAFLLPAALVIAIALLWRRRAARPGEGGRLGAPRSPAALMAASIALAMRSEERRVGKECTG